MELYSPSKVARSPLYSARISSTDSRRRAERYLDSGQSSRNPRRSPKGLAGADSERDTPQVETDYCREGHGDHGGAVANGESQHRGAEHDALGPLADVGHLVDAKGA